MSLTYTAGHQLLCCRHSSAGYCTACVTILWRPFRFRSSDSCSVAFYHPHWQSNSQKIGMQALRLPASLTLVIFSTEKGTEEGQQVHCLNRNPPGYRMPVPLCGSNFSDYLAVSLSSLWGDGCLSQQAEHCL